MANIQQILIRPQFIWLQETSPVFSIQRCNLNCIILYTATLELWSYLVYNRLTILNITFKNITKVYSK